MVRYLFYTIGDLTYQSPLVLVLRFPWNMSAPLNTIPRAVCSGKADANVCPQDEHIEAG